MSLKTYLICCNETSIYPGQLESFDYKTQVYLQCDLCLPALWLALFSVEDGQLIYLESDDDDGEIFPNFWAPLARVDEAIMRLQKRLPFLIAVFEGQSDIVNYANALMNYLREVPHFANVTIQYNEMQSQWNDISFYQNIVKQAIAALDNQDKKTRELILDLSTIEPNNIFAPFDLWMKDNCSEAQGYNGVRLLGESMWRRAPWDMWRRAP